MPKKYKKQDYQKTSNNRDSKTDPFYNTKYWKTVRAYIRRTEIFCRECKIDGLLIPGTTVDHITPRNDGGSDGMDNLQLLCTRCHASKSASERRDR